MNGITVATGAGSLPSRCLFQQNEVIEGCIESDILPGIKFVESTNDDFDIIEYNSARDVLKNIKKDYDKFSSYYLVNYESPYYVDKCCVKHVVTESIFIGSNGKIDYDKAFNDGVSSENLTREDFFSIRDLFNLHQIWHKRKRISLKSSFDHWGKKIVLKKDVLTFQRVQLKKYQRNLMHYGLYLLNSNQVEAKTSRESLALAREDHVRYLTELGEKINHNLNIVQLFLDKHGIIPKKFKITRFAIV